MICADGGSCGVRVIDVRCPSCGAGPGQPCRDRAESQAMVRVRWLDSWHDQVDASDLPTPSELVTVGWLSWDDPAYIVVSRDHSPSPGSYSWRSSLAIPRAHIIELEEIKCASMH